MNKHNERNPGKEILYLNYAAVDPDFTNSKCSFWHFRFDANSDMKMEALTTYIAQNKNIKKVYLINQNYSFGQAVKRARRKADLARKRPDIQIVGDDLHPLGQVKDFAPYVAKMKAAGADTVITGNWGNDMTLLIKAARMPGSTSTFYTYYAGGARRDRPRSATPASGKVKQITEWHANVADNKTAKSDALPQVQAPKDNPDFYFLRGNIMWEMFAKAIEAGEVGRAEGGGAGARRHELRGRPGRSRDAHDRPPADPAAVTSRPSTSPRPRAGPRTAKTTWRTAASAETDARIEGYTSAQPTSCQMKRP